MGKLELVLSFCYKVAYEAIQMNVMTDYVTEMTLKKSCKYCQYGLFEHFLFLGLFCLFVRNFY